MNDNVMMSQLQHETATVLATFIVVSIIIGAGRVLYLAFHRWYYERWNSRILLRHVPYRKASHKRKARVFPVWTSYDMEHEDRNDPLEGGRYGCTAYEYATHGGII